jgi:hypothetical protein
MENISIKSNIINTSNNKNEEYLNNKQIISIEEEKFHRANFQLFLENFRKKEIFYGASWNKHRENHNREQQNKRKIILKEIDQFDSSVNIKPKFKIKKQKTYI